MDPVKLPPGKLWSKWETLPWLPKTDSLKKKKACKKAKKELLKPPSLIDV